MGHLTSSKLELALSRTEEFTEFMTSKSRVNKLI